jgi:hypothetical protein
MKSTIAFRRLAFACAALASTFATAQPAPTTAPATTPASTTTTTTTPATATTPATVTTTTPASTTTTTTTPATATTPATITTTTSQTFYISDDEKLDRDHLRLWTNVKGFQPGNKCAVKNSTLIVKSEDNGILTVIFYSFPTEPKVFDEDSKAWKAAEDDCKDRVNLHTAYTIPRGEVEKAGYRRTGMVFGGLVVPFKYRLGGDKKIVSSSTVAPYVGFRTGWGQSWGATFTPLVSAGLGLVPVSDPATNQTETKNALSFAFGMVLTSSKNQKFSAGFLLGKDFLSAADQARDPNVEKAWLSFYVGSNF